jgi:hypothetical protein
MSTVIGSFIVIGIAPMAMFGVVCAGVFIAGIAALGAFEAGETIAPALGVPELDMPLGVL